MADIRHAQCHCGAVKFTVELTDGLNTHVDVAARFAGCVGR